jgi:hypothetical protein
MTGGLAVSISSLLLYLVGSAHSQTTALQRPPGLRLWVDTLLFSPADSLFLRTEVAKSNGQLVIAGGASAAVLLLHESPPPS